MQNTEIESVVAAAVTGASPREVMPPDDDPRPDTWTQQRVSRFSDFLLSRLIVLSDGRQESVFVVEVDGQTAGVARLLAAADKTVVETGVWLSSKFRGRGVGGQVLTHLMAAAQAAGGVELIAETTTDNDAALAALRHLGAVLTESAEEPGRIDARLYLANR